MLEHRGTARWHGQDTVTPCLLQGDILQVGDSRSTQHMMGRAAKCVFCVFCFSPYVSISVMLPQTTLWRGWEAPRLLCTRWGATRVCPQLLFPPCQGGIVCVCPPPAPPLALCASLPL